MRIPSQFNDETLYGRRGRQPKSSQSYRRLIRLSVALTLVVVVMQQAGDVAIYETFFGDSLGGGGTKPTPARIADNAQTPVNVTSQTAGHEEPSASRTERKSLVTPEMTQTAVQITQALDVNAQRHWTVVLDQWQTGEQVTVIESMVQSLIDVVKQCEDIDDEQRLSWAATLDEFGHQHASADEVFRAMLKQPSPNSAAGEHDAETATRSLDPSDTARLTAMLSSLDQAAVDRVVDGTIWRSDDFDAFYRQLDQAPLLSRDGALKVSVVPLMQQPKTYLGRRVRVDGKVARVTKKIAAANPFGVDEYWEIWLRPSSGGDRPFVVIVPEVPDVVQKLNGEMNVTRGPAIKIVGRFFKRLAYGSQLGADAAPVVVGRILGLEKASQNNTANANTTAAKARSSMLDLWTAVALASFAGVSIAALVMWRTKTLAQRSRQLRQSSRPAPDLSFDQRNESSP